MILLFHRVLVSLGSFLCITIVHHFPLSVIDAIVIFFLKDGPTPASFIVYFRSFQKIIIQFLQQVNVPGFEPTTFGTRVSSLNH